MKPYKDAAALEAYVGRRNTPGYRPMFSSDRPVTVDELNTNLFLGYEISSPSQDRTIKPEELSNIFSIKYPYGKGRDIDVFETAQYTADGAWAHTEPQRGVVCILPPELRDYRLPIMPHELLHNAFPDASESWIHHAAFDPANRKYINGFVLHYD